MAITELENNTERLNEYIESLQSNPDLSPSKISDEIQKELRQDCVYIPIAYGDSFEYKDINYPNHELKDTVTIDPEQTSIVYKKDCYRIGGYSFGPFSSSEYFKQPNKIVWLLKEPLCKNKEEISLKCQRNDDHYNQATTYATWEDILEAGKDATTIKNLVNISKDILEKLQDKNLTENEVMKSLCVIEINHFPGLALKQDIYRSNDKLKYWASINQNLIIKLIDFYRPEVLVCGGTLSSYDEMYRNENYDIIRKDIRSGKLHLFNKLVLEMRYVSDQNNNVFKNIAYLDVSGRIIISANHPSRISNYTKDLRLLDSIFIKELNKCYESYKDKG